ncbi:hypothetical protein PVK06_001382 [Gossypium arboreum]|uniref:Uncharacterized protein n=1 Tax=Gossypium arboreum TaxID=29729 RepID=A0ABR0R229_GOSAR|nr:hypothetical protein PVK06_001382 [Gossypium arboreum]
MGFVLVLLKSLDEGLILWAHNIKWDKKRNEILLQRLLDLLNGMDPTEEVLSNLVDVKLVFNLSYDMEELYWEHMARVNWLQHGDRNSTIFHRWLLRSVTGIIFRDWWPVMVGWWIQLRKLVE